MNTGAVQIDQETKLYRKQIARCRQQ